MLSLAVPSEMGGIAPPPPRGQKGRGGTAVRAAAGGETEVLLSQGRMGCSGRGQDLSRHGMRRAPSSACFPCGDFGSGLGESHVRDSDGAGGMRRSRLGTTGMHRLHPPRPDPHLAPRCAKKHQEGFSTPAAETLTESWPCHPQNCQFCLFFSFFPANMLATVPALPADPGSSTKTLRPPSKAAPTSLTMGPRVSQAPNLRHPRVNPPPCHGFTLPCRRASAEPAPSSSSCNAPARMKMLSEPLGGGERGWM